jgi:pimeloyl-ACP methyl ester carboxylesterase
VTDAKGLLGLEERLADAGGCAMHYFVGGLEDGQPLILVHGLGGAAENWVELVPRLRDSFRLLVPDLPGHGGSAPLSEPPSLTDYAERVAVVADREGFLPGNVVGHSFGGLVSLRLALVRPEDVRRLVLACPAGISSTARRARFALQVLGVLKPARRVARHREVVGRSARLRYLVFGRWGAADPAALSESAVEGFLSGALLHTDTVSAARALVADDPRAELESLRCPCLLLWGARDTQLPVDDAFEYARRMRAELRVVADCGHLLIGERPDACAGAIAEFLNRGAQI